MTTLKEARERRLQGWNIRCNRCGSYGASWVLDQRPGFGAFAACPPHREEIAAELARHSQAMQTLTAVRFEQDGRA